MYSKIVEKIGSGGSIITAMGCASCFPALGSVGAAFGLGFLSAYEGLFINTLLPVFAAIVLISNLVVWWGHRNHLRGVISTLGPTMVLATLYPLWKFGWSTHLFYTGLILMLIISIWDLSAPAHRTCDVLQ